VSTASTPLARARAICAALAVLACACAGIPLTAESGDGLHGAYFDNQDLSGTPVLERTDPQVAFDWDGGAPDASVPADGFSVRWDGWVVPDTTGAHTFHARTDDGVRLWVDGELLVDNWKDQGAKERSGTVSLLAGRPVAIRMEYYENGGGAVAELRWTPPGGSKAFVPQAVLFTAAPSNPPPLAGGLQGSYFANPDLYADPVLERLDPEPQFDWGSGSPDPSIPVDDFSVRWVGRITAPVAGAYRFHTRTDDGTNLWIDGELVVDDWNDHGPTTRTSREFTLAEGQVVQVVWEYYESGGGAVAELLWSYGGSPIHAMPTFALDPDIDPSIYLGTGTGLSARYFNNPHVDGEPDLERIDPAIDFRWGGSSPDPAINAEHFSVEWTGTIETQYSEDYTLEYAADDGVLIWIDGRLLIDEWHPNGGSIHSATFRGEAGKRFPIRVLHYEKTGNAQARLYWSSASRPRQLVPEDRLYPTEAAAPSLTIPASSPVSPAFVEGSVPAGRTGDLTITAGATDVTPHELTARSFFADLPLDPAAAQPISIGLPDGTPVTGSITWTPTPLDGGPAVVIRQDDRLLFPASPGSTLTVLTASGTYATQTVPAAGQAVFAFPDPGHYVVQDESLKERDVTVVGIDHTAPVACEVGYTRPLDVPLAPDTTDAVFGANDPSQLGVQTGAFDATTGLQALSLTPAKRGTPRLTARIGDDAGPVLWVREIDEFTIENTAQNDILVFGNTGTGKAIATMRPYIPDLDVEFDMFSGPATWADGSLLLATNTSDGAGGDPAWRQVTDPVTGETVGESDLVFSMPPGGDGYCFRTTVFQTNSPTIQISTPKNANGAACTVTAYGGTFVIPETTDEYGDNLVEDESGFLVQENQHWKPTQGNVLAVEDGEGGNGYRLKLAALTECEGLEDAVAGEFPVPRELECEVAEGEDPISPRAATPSGCDDPDNPVWDDPAAPCEDIWPTPPQCEPCNDECKPIGLHTAARPGSQTLKLFGCLGEDGNDLDTDQDELLFYNKVDLNGWTGPLDTSSRDAMPEVCLIPELPTEGTVTLRGTPVQVLLIGKKKAKVRVFSQTPDLCRVHTEATIDMDLEGADPDTIDGVLPPNACPEIELQKVDDRHFSGVVYVYGLQETTEQPAKIQSMMLESRMECSSPGEDSGPMQTGDWVVSDEEPFDVTQTLTRVYKVTFDGDGGISRDDKWKLIPSSPVSAGVKNEKFYNNEGTESPDWWDKNCNSVASEVGEHRWPILYAVSGADDVQMRQCVLHICTKNITNENDILVRAAGKGAADGYSIDPTTPEEVQMGGDCGADWTVIVGATDIKGPKFTAVKFFNPFVLEWEISFDSGASWTSAGKTDNRIYVIMRRQANYLETHYHLACKNADGLSDPVEIRDAIWQDFEQKNVRRKPLDGFNNVDDQQLKYWAWWPSGNAPNQTPNVSPPSSYEGTERYGNWNRTGFNLIALKDGPCQTWVILLMELTNQLQGGQMLRFRVTVDESKFTPTAEGNSVTGYHWMELNANSRGQGMPVPPNKTIFNNHSVAKWGEEIFDPSYGRRFNRESEWESESVDIFPIHEGDQDLWEAEDFGGFRSSATREEHANTDSQETKFERRGD